MSRYQNKNQWNKIEIPEELSDSKKTFLLLFIGIIWREAYKTSFEYCRHNYTPVTKKAVISSLKFNVFSSNGFVTLINKYIQKGLKDGFLMPQTYNEVGQIRDAVMRYKEAYDIIIIADDEIRSEKEIEFIKSFTDINLSHDNRFDSLTSLFGTDTCRCKTCIKIISWGKNNKESKDWFRDIVIYRLTYIINTLRI